MYHLNPLFGVYAGFLTFVDFYFPHCDAPTQRRQTVEKLVKRLKKSVELLSFTNYEFDLARGNTSGVMNDLIVALIHTDSSTFAHARAKTR